MGIKKVAKTHTSSRKKTSAASSTMQGTKRVAAKAPKRAGKSASKRKLTEDEWRKLQKLTLKMCQMVYEDYQQGKFHRLF